MKISAMTKKCNKIGIDFHGVINTNPVFFKDLANAFLQQHISIHIISGGPSDYIGEYLRKYHIPYTQIWCIYDYYDNKGLITTRDDGSFYMDDELWNKAKADYCRQNAICLQIDDSSVYGTYFTTPYCQYHSGTRTGILSGHQITFSGQAELCVKQLLDILAEN